MKIQQNTDIQMSKEEIVELLLAGLKAKYKKLLPVEFDPKNVKLEFQAEGDENTNIADLIISGALKFPMIEQAGPQAATTEA